MHVYVHISMYPPIYKMQFKGTDGIVGTEPIHCNEAENVCNKAVTIKLLSNVVSVRSLQKFVGSLVGFINASFIHISLDKRN